MASAGAKKSERQINLLFKRPDHKSENGQELRERAKARDKFAQNMSQRDASGPSQPGN